VVHIKPTPFQKKSFLVVILFLSEGGTPFYLLECRPPLYLLVVQFGIIAVLADGLSPALAPVLFGDLSGLEPFGIGKVEAMLGGELTACIEDAATDHDVDEPRGLVALLNLPSAGLAGAEGNESRFVAVHFDASHSRSPVGVVGNILM